MSENFYELYLPKYENVFDEVQELVNLGIINWQDGSAQVMVNTTVDHPDDLYFGTGSLYYDWANATEGENGFINVEPFDTPIDESEFVLLNSQFVGTVIEKMYNMLDDNYNLGRVRLMNFPPKYCLTWHVDAGPRVHYPIKTQEGCFMVIEDEVKHLEQDKWWFSNAVLPHTAFNGSKEDRLHLVAHVISSK